ATALESAREARPTALAWDDPVARTDTDQAVRQRHGSAGELGGQEGTRIEAPVPLDPARHQHAWKGLRGGQLQIGVVLVVAKQDVVFGISLLDEVILESQRLDD